MSYNIHNLFPIPLFEAIIDEELISSDVQLIISKLEESDSLHENSDNFATNESFVLDNWNLFQIKKNIMNALEVFAQEVLNYEYEKIYITQSWINVNPPKSSHHYHSHPNSILSGVFYLQAFEECGNIRFHKPSRELEPQVKFDEENYFTWETRYFSPINNQLLIFPSNLFHDVSPNLSTDKNRISLSFNTFMNPLGSKEHKTFLQ